MPDQAAPGAGGTFVTNAGEAERDGGEVATGSLVGAPDEATTKLVLGEPDAA